MKRLALVACLLSGCAGHTVIQDLAVQDPITGMSLRLSRYDSTKDFVASFSNGTVHISGNASVPMTVENQRIKVIMDGAAGIAGAVVDSAK